MTSDTTMTTAEYALAEYHAEAARIAAERDARAADEAAQLRARRAEINAAAIEAHRWLFDHAGATYDADADLIRTDDGLYFEAGIPYSRQNETIYTIAFIPVCTTCGAPAPDPGGNDWKISTILELGAAIHCYNQGPTLCRTCREAEYRSWCEREDDDPAPVENGPSRRPSRSGWVYLPTREQWLNGATIESVSLEDAGAELFAVFTTPGDGGDGQGVDYIRDDHDVAALVRWLEGWDE